MGFIPDPQPVSGSGFTPDNNSSTASPTDTQEAPKFSLTPTLEEAQKMYGSQVGSFNRFSDKAGAGAREAIRAIGTSDPVEAYKRGFDNPETSPTAQQSLSGMYSSAVPTDNIQTSQNPYLSAAKNTAIQIGGLVPAAVGAASDVLTNPNQAIGMAMLDGLPKIIAEANPSIAKNIVDFANKQRSLKSVSSDVMEGMDNVAKNIKLAFSPKLGPNLPKVAQIDEAAQLVDANLSSLKQINSEKKFNLYDTIDSQALENKIKDSINLAKLDSQRTNVAYSQAEAIHGDPVASRGGDVGLGLKASKNLDNAYWQEAEPLMKKEVMVSDVKDGIKTTLQNAGALDFQGNPIPNADISSEHGKLLNFYKSLPEDGKMTVGELKSNLESNLGKSPSGSALVRDAWSEAAQYISEIKDLNAKYVTDFQARNGVFDKFHIFDRIGWRKGDVSLKPGTDLLKNLASENPAEINPDNVKLMDFIKKYTGVDPSEPVVGIGNKIKTINQVASSRDIANTIAKSDMDRQVFQANLQATRDAQVAKSSLAQLRNSAAIKEAKQTLMKSRINKAAWTAAGISTGGAALTAKKFGLF